MKVAIIGASGKTGIKLLEESLERGYEVAAVCRNSSLGKLDEFSKSSRLSIFSAPVISDEGILLDALEGCDAVVVIMMAAGKLKATDLVSSLARASQKYGIKRLVFTAGEITVVREPDERYTNRQKLMLAVAGILMWLSPFSLTDMRRASLMIRMQNNWEYTIVRAPTLVNKPSTGYDFCDIWEVTSSHALSREDYASCLLDSLTVMEHCRKTLTVIARESKENDKS